MSIYASYVQGLETTPAAPISAANAGATLPATQSTQQEAGIKLEALSGLLVQIAYFDIRRGSAYINGANVYVLDGRAQYRGAEFSVTGEATPNWSLYVTGQVLDATQIAGADTQITTNPTTGTVTVVPTVVGRQIENTPKYTFSFASEYRLPKFLPGFSLNGGVYFVGRRAVNQFNQAFIPGYTLFDLGAAYALKLYGKETTIRLMGQDIGDKRYFSSTGGNFVAQGPPRMVKFSLTTRL
jgi:iron complex outermembrane receptor protein